MFYRRREYNFAGRGTALGLVCSGAIFLALAAWQPRPANAQFNACNALESNSGVNPIRVNQSTFNGAPNLGWREVRAATSNAVAMWNSNAAGAYFSFDGATTCVGTESRTSPSKVGFFENLSPLVSTPR